MVKLQKFFSQIKFGANFNSYKKYFGTEYFGPKYFDKINTSSLGKA